MGRKKVDKSGLDPELFTKSGKPRTRKKKQSREYFNQETEDAIVKYNQSTDDRERNALFNKYIYYSMYKLVENIIHTFKFYYTDTLNIEELKYEVMVFLLEKFHRYDPTQGKAYSYFGTITLRWLINNNRKNYAKLKNKGAMDEVDEDVLVLVNMHNEMRELDNITIMNDFVKHVKANLDSLYEKDKDRQIAEMLLDLFDNRDYIQIFNKQSFYLHIREMTGADTPQITRVVKVLKTVYGEILDRHFVQGDL